MAHESDVLLVKNTRNTARFLTEYPHITWVLLVATVLFGVYGYRAMSKRKDPDIPVRIAAALLTWPGANAENMEERVTRVIERKLAENARIDKIDSTSRAGIAVVTMTLDQAVNETGKEFDDIWLKLSSVRLPAGAGMQFIKDFGDTSALMLTVASPRASEIEIQLRAEKIAEAIRQVRRDVPATGEGSRAAVVGCFPFTLDERELGIVGKDLAAWAESRGDNDVRTFAGDGFLGIDARTVAADETILTNAREFIADHIRASDLHPDIWRLAVIREPAETEAKLAPVAVEKYSYRELDRYTESLEKSLQGLPQVARVSRAGILDEVVFLDYSQEKLASYGVGPAQIRDALSARNIVARGGAVEVQGKTVLIAADGELRGEQEIGGIIVTTSSGGSPVYLRDLVTISRAYETPQYLSYSTWKDTRGNWQTTRAITLSLTMKGGQQIASFGRAVDAKIAAARALMPEDLVVKRVSDQPQQVADNVELFMSSLYEAIALVVLVALVGFWEWRSALLMALSIPLTLAMTFGFMKLVGMDVQQVSIAALIIALGLLVDDPVVAGDAIKRELARGQPNEVAAWLGPTKLSTAIMFATATNIAAYLPFLTLSGDTGRFIYSLPIVLTASLIASRLVSMSFVPMLGRYLLQAGEREAPMSERRQRGFAKWYAKLVMGAVKHRFRALGVASLLLVLGSFAASGLESSFFPKDLSYLSYVDVWLPEDSRVESSREKANEVEAVIREVAGPRGLQSITTFVGGGGPRFWFSVAPEQRQTNYAQLIIRMTDKRETSKLIAPLQHALSSRIPGALIDVREIESGPAIGVPVSVRISGEDPRVLRRLAFRVEDAMRKQPYADRYRNDWGADNSTVELSVDTDRAAAAGVSNDDVATSSGTALNGSRVGTLQEREYALPITLRLRASERAQLSDIGNLYVYSTSNPNAKVPLRQIANLDFAGTTAKIVRRNHLPTITVGAFPSAGHVPSDVLNAMRPELERLESELPPGYSMQIGGEKEEQEKSFKELMLVLLVCIGSIFMALVLQFRHAAKPLVVFATIPFGVVAGLLSLRIAGAPFGFMAFLGVISLIGVIVSHVIVLFDLVEEKHTEGEPLFDALIDAGIIRLRPVLVTVGATVLGLVPLALHGGPLWEPLCYVQIGGLILATLITLVLVPVLYAVFVLDLKIVKWKGPSRTGEADADSYERPGEPLSAGSRASCRELHAGQSAPVERPDPVAAAT